MFGEGISIGELLLLLNAIRKKDLQGKIKILDGPWENISSTTLQAATRIIEQNGVQGGEEIHLRLHVRE